MWPLTSIFRFFSVLPTCVLFGGTVPPTSVLFGGTVPPAWVLFGGTVPPNNQSLKIKHKKLKDLTFLFHTTFQNDVLFITKKSFQLFSIQISSYSTFSWIWICFTSPGSFSAALWSSSFSLSSAPTKLKIKEID